MSAERQPLYYTFGNHMHWVDMQWLWGYQTLPDSIRDMLDLCNATGARGNINFDAIGYEKLASENPQSLAELQQAVKSGQLEVVGGSYGQPYGLFHGSESNVRQRIYGVRTTQRVLGVAPRTFWEEEFDFFPQLPQILRGVGYEYASLFFQWTWHTPELPKETVAAVWWEGQDGSRLLASPRSTLNIHQWPEDFEGVLDQPLIRELPVATLVQWLELMPSPDWMCRSELLLPQLQALIADPRFEIRFGTLSEVLEPARAYAEPRRYRMDDVFHGMSIGKNGDLMRRLSRRAEFQLLAAESLSATMGLFGRPYPHWDVYPTWELEEGWRELLAAQHHDNDECEGLCGHVGKYSYERSLSLSGEVLTRAAQTLADRVAGSGVKHVLINPLGWARRTPLSDQPVPAFGYLKLDSDAARPPAVTVPQSNGTVALERGGLRVEVDSHRGLITSITSPDFPQGALPAGTHLLDLHMTVHGSRWTFPTAAVNVVESPDGPAIHIVRQEGSARVKFMVSLAPDADAVDVQVIIRNLPRPDSRMHAALQTRIPLAANTRLIHDYPYGLDEIRAEGTYLRKYPTGEWMTSPQVFETVERPFTALNLLDMVDAESGRGLLLLHDGSEGFFHGGDHLNLMLSMYDAWDEDYFVSDLDARLRFVPHAGLTHTQRWRLAHEFQRPLIQARSDQPNGTLPPVFETAACDAPNVTLSALYRETTEHAALHEQYAGAGMGFPYVLRLVELDGVATEARVRLFGPVAAAYKTNLLGQIEQTLDVSTQGDFPDEVSTFTIALRPYEIATVMFDAVHGRKQPRNLDAHRHIWSRVHRVGE
ncbi:MAG TPA: glycosyl hydrolase-related protein [Aggregatilineales bacterium]|nr:glycosyl hydrolase-related protein [Aggregatilineales bacterium]